MTETRATALHRQGQRLLDELDHLPWWQALILGASLGVLLTVVGLAWLGGWWGLGLLLVVAGVMGLCWKVEPLLVLEEEDELSVAPEPVVQRVSLSGVVDEQVGAPTALTDPLGDGLLPMVPMEGGTFLMGSADEDSLAYFDERPQHQVSLSAFFLSETPITRGLYRKYAEDFPEQWNKDTDDDQLPANYLSWFAAVAFCNQLSTQAGLTPCYQIDGRAVNWNREADGYRLPTEAEWEYACRAGTTTRWFWGDDASDIDDYAWYEDNAGGTVQPVGTKKPNPWQLYDMSGNVWEWCWDWMGHYSGQRQTDPIGPPNGRHRVVRGGAFHLVPRNLRSACRDVNLGPEDRDMLIGFRVACSRPQP